MRPRGCGLIAIFCCAWALNGEVRLRGRVSSDTGTPVAGAAVTVRAAGGPAVLVRAIADPAGGFALNVPTAGDYLLDVEATGYFKLKDRAVEVTEGEHELSVTLNPVREFADSVDVSASSGSVELDRTSSEQTLTGAQIVDIPFPVTHDLKTAMRALPNVVQDNSNGIHLNGGAENQTLYLLDGFNVANPLTGTFDTRLSVEGVQEVTVESGAVRAQYGKGSAGVIAVDMRTGDDRLRYSATNFVPGIENNKGFRVGSYNPRFSLSGPVRRGRVWFSDSFWGQYNQTVIRELPPGQDTARSLRYSNYLHVQANLTPRNIASFGFLASLWSANDTGLGALDPAPTTVDRRSRQWFAYGKDQFYFGGGAVLELGFASNRTFLRQIPHGTDLYVYTPWGRSGNYFVRGVQDSSRDQGIANAYLPSFRWLGAHQFKTGADINWLAYGQNLARTGYEWLDANNLPVRRVLFAGNGRLSRKNFEAASYVQDSWRVRPSLLLEVGARSDWDTLLANWTASPRLGLAWSPPWLENTRVSGGYAVTFDATNLELFTRPYDEYPVTYYYPPFGTPAAPVRAWFLLSGGYRSPRFATWNAAVDHRFGRNLFVRVEGIRRRGVNGLTYVGSSGLSSATDSVFRLLNARDDFYDALQVTMRQNFRKEYGWMVSYTRSRARSSEVLDFASDTPLLTNANSGRLPWDSPDRFLFWGYLPAFRKNWAVAFLGEYRSGFPFSIVDTAGQVVGPVNGGEFPAFFELNLHLERRFDWRGQRWAGRVGYNNITGRHNSNTVANVIGTPQFLTFYGGQSRALQFRIRWLGKL